MKLFLWLTAVLLLVVLASVEARPKHFVRNLAVLGGGAYVGKKLLDRHDEKKEEKAGKE